MPVAGTDGRTQVVLNIRKWQRALKRAKMPIMWVAAET